MRYDDGFAVLGNIQYNWLAFIQIVLIKLLVSHYIRYYMRYGTLLHNFACHTKINNPCCFVLRFTKRYFTGSLNIFFVNFRNYGNTNFMTILGH